MKKIKLVVTDLDNTIYNWVDFYVPSFLAMIQELSKLTGISQAELKASFKRIHEKYRTTEYTFAIQQLDVLQEINSGLDVKQILRKYEPAIRAFRKTRKKTLRLYEGVKETLTEIHNQGKKIAGRTDALMFHAIMRLKQLGIEDLYDGIFAPPDHGFPPGTTPEDVRFYNNSMSYETKIPIRVELNPSIRKPDPRALLIVLDHFNAKPEETVYIGDSLLRDALLAQKCGIHDVYAEYGQKYDPKHYEELLKITYWPEEEIEKEGSPSITEVKPTFVLSCFSELSHIIRGIESGTRLL
jgi:phosphoglycolate phosphatase